MDHNNVAGPTQGTGKEEGDVEKTKSNTSVKLNEAPYEPKKEGSERAVFRRIGRLITSNRRVVGNIKEKKGDGGKSQR